MFISVFISAYHSYVHQLAPIKIFHPTTPRFRQTSSVCLCVCLSVSLSVCLVGLSCLSRLSFSLALSPSFRFFSFPPFLYPPTPSLPPFTPHSPSTPPLPLLQSSPHLSLPTSGSITPASRRVQMRNMTRSCPDTSFTTRRLLRTVGAARKINDSKL